MYYASSVVSHWSISLFDENLITVTLSPLSVVIPLPYIEIQMKLFVYYTIKWLNEHNY